VWAPLAVAAPPSGVSEIDWRTSPLDLNLRGRDGERFRFRCPAGRVERGQVLGSSPYTDGSSICAAAAHAGLIHLGAGGLVVIEMRAGQAHYPASLSHGVQSESYEKFWSGSFVVLSAETAAPTAGTVPGHQADSTRQNTTGAKP
jgi:LCCL domain